MRTWHLVTNALTLVIPHRCRGRGICWTIRHVQTIQNFWFRRWSSVVCYCNLEHFDIYNFYALKIYKTFSDFHRATRFFCTICSPWLPVPLLSSGCTLTFYCTHYAIKPSKARLLGSLTVAFPGSGFTDAATGNAVLVSATGASRPRQRLHKLPRLKNTLLLYWLL